MQQQFNSAVPSPLSYPMTTAYTASRSNSMTATTSAGTKPPAKRKQVKNACVNCQKACKKCDDGRPCQRCVKYGLTDTCRDSTRKERKKGIKRGPYKRRQNPTSANGAATTNGTDPSRMAAAGYGNHPGAAAQAPFYTSSLQHLPMNETFAQPYDPYTQGSFAYSRPADAYNGQYILDPAAHSMTMAAPQEFYPQYHPLTASPAFSPVVAIPRRLSMPQNSHLAASPVPTSQAATTAEGEESSRLKFLSQLCSNMLSNPNEQKSSIDDGSHQQIQAHAADKSLPRYLHARSNSNLSSHTHTPPPSPGGSRAPEEEEVPMLYMNGSNPPMYRTILTSTPPMQVMNSSALANARSAYGTPQSSPTSSPDASTFLITTSNSIPTSSSSPRNYHALPPLYGQAARVPLPIPPMVASTQGTLNPAQHIFQKRSPSPSGSDSSISSLEPADPHHRYYQANPNHVPLVHTGLSQSIVPQSYLDTKIEFSQDYQTGSQNQQLPSLVDHGYNWY